MPEFVVFLLSPPVEGMVVTQGALHDHCKENATIHAFRLVIASPPGRDNPLSSLYVIARKVSQRTDAAIQS